MAKLKALFQRVFVAVYNKRAILLLFPFFTIILISSCNRDFSPKKRGYYRIKFPAKKYVDYQKDCPFVFQYPDYAKILSDLKSAKPCWFDVAYPQFNARLHVSYQKVTSKVMFNRLVEDSRTFAFKHTVKATAINEGYISLPKHDVYGILYKIDGNTASALQFFLTDSNRHYLRGALYFHEKPHRDSIQPVIDFLEKDIEAMIKSLRWK